MAVDFDNEKFNTFDGVRRKIINCGFVDASVQVSTRQPTISQQNWTLFLIAQFSPDDNRKELF